MGYTTVNRSSGKVLSFSRSYDYYMRIGFRMQQQGRYIEAAHNFRMARQKNPSSSEAAFALAEVLCSLDRYDESNALLYEQFIGGDTSERCFFGIAFNYMCQKQYGNAEKWATIYLNKYPEGDYVYDAQEMLSLIFTEKESAQDNLYSYSNAERESITNSLAQASHYTGTGDTDSAIAILEGLCEKYPELTSLKLNLALTRFCAKDYDRATSAVREILDDSPDDIPALCCLAMLLSASLEFEESAALAKRLKAARTDEPTDVMRIATTLMNMHFYKDARDMYARLLEYFPYMVLVNHGMGVCDYELGNYEQAAKRYELLLKLDPSDTIASYYLQLCRSEDKAKRRVRIPHTYQVPYSEVLSRLDRIKLMTEEQEKISPEAAALLTWGLTTLDEHMKSVCLQIIAAYGGEVAEGILKRFILRQDESFDIKVAALRMLEIMGAEKPYGMLTDSAEIITSFAYSPERSKLPAAYLRIGDRLYTSLKVSESTEAKREALRIYNTFVKKAHESGHFPQLTPPMEDALTAAIELLALKKLGGDTDFTALMEAYDVTERRLNNALKRITDVLALPDKPDDEEDK